ncbi:hypothetical protein B0O99DRAFT_298407 [Bisporella sp. PMI_857]|nr:hypothetical protein B0O99DRAFT_298407 [Bisporella sp. PMI_857]
MAATPTSGASAPPTQQQHVLSATYQSPDNVAFTFTRSLPATNGTSAEKVAYLAALRAATLAMQEHINTELTARMEEDKARDASDGKGVGRAKAVDEAEEDNYGEEVPEED